MATTASPYSSSSSGPSLGEALTGGRGGAGGAPLMDDAESNLEGLISHLVAAKRSLSSISHVWRANEIVNTAGAAVEESALLSAREKFIRRGLHDQLRLLYKIRAEVEEVSRRGLANFAAILKELDAVDERLKETMGNLKATTVDPAFRAPGSELVNLYDFVEERPVEDLHTMLKRAIDSISAAQESLEESNMAFDKNLRLIRRALEGGQVTEKKHKKQKKRASGSASSLSTSSLTAPSPSRILAPRQLPEYLRSLESNAQEMAGLLQSLVRHFDLCVTAVKHTEGGGAAARTITGDLPSGIDTTTQRTENNLGDPDAPPPEPLTDSEYREMVSVITNDAAEAEDVVLEIQDRIAAMESTLDQVLEERYAIISTCSSASDIFRDLLRLSTIDVPVYVTRAQHAQKIWREEHESIQVGMNELIGLRGLYAGFINAYDELILEADRRRSAQAAIERVLKDARIKLDQIYDDDMRARENFRIEKGDYLPSDIWPGLSRGPSMVEFTKVFEGKQVGEETKRRNDGDVVDATPSLTNAGAEQPRRVAAGYPSDSIPDLPKDLIERAKTRTKMRRKKGFSNQPS